MDIEDNALKSVQDYIQNKLYNPYNYEISVWYDDEFNYFEISTDKWSMDLYPMDKRLCFNGDGIDSKEFDQIMGIRDNKDTIWSIYNREMRR
jgi:hypothetical protein